jgi:hypothetical protein
LLAYSIGPDPQLEAHYSHFSPDTPLYPETQKGQRYFTSCYTHNPTGGDHVAFVWRDDPKAAQLVAAMGSAHSWPLLRSAEFRALWPEGTKAEDENPPAGKQATFAWSDANGDGSPQPNEVRFYQGVVARGDRRNRPHFLIARHGENAGAV